MEKSNETLLKLRQFTATKLTKKLVLVVILSISVINFSFTFIYYQDWRFLLKFVHLLKVVDIPRYWMDLAGRYYGYISADAARWFFPIFICTGLLSMQGLRRKPEVKTEKIKSTYFEDLPKVAPSPSWLDEMFSAFMTRNNCEICNTKVETGTRISAFETVLNTPTVFGTGPNGSSYAVLVDPRLDPNKGLIHYSCFSRIFASHCHHLGIQCRRCKSEWTQMDGIRPEKSFHHVSNTLGIMAATGDSHWGRKKDGEISFTCRKCREKEVQEQIKVDNRIKARNTRRNTSNSWSSSFPQNDPSKEAHYNSMWGMSDSEEGEQ